MKDLQASLDSWVESTRTRVKELAGTTPEWLGPLRDRAVAELAEVGFPTRRSEEWRYSNVRHLVEGPFRTPLSAAIQSDQLSLHQYDCAAFDGPKLVFVDGLFRAELSRSRPRSPGEPRGSRPRSPDTRRDDIPSALSTPRVLLMAMDFARKSSASSRWSSRWKRRNSSR